MAAVAIAADADLCAAIHVGAQKEAGGRDIVMGAPTALLLSSPPAWTHAAAAAILPLQSCLCPVLGTVSGTAPKQNCQVMGRRRACLAIPTDE
jgi:hypothetical protein